MYRIFNLLRKGGSAVGGFGRQGQKFIDLYRQVNRQRQRNLHLEDLLLEMDYQLFT